MGSIDVARDFGFQGHIARLGTKLTKDARKSIELRARIGLEVLPALELAELTELIEVSDRRARGVGNGHAVSIEDDRIALVAIELDAAEVGKKDADTVGVGRSGENFAIAIDKIVVWRSGLVRVRIRTTEDDHLIFFLHGVGVLG